MPNYLVESYLARSNDALELASEHARRAADLAAGKGHWIRYVRTTLVQADETCFHVFEADSQGAVEAAMALGELSADRIAQADETHASAATSGEHIHRDERSTT